MTQVVLGPVSWERVERAVQKVRDRLLRATAALDRAGVPYAVVGGNAVAAWVSRIDEAAVRNTRDVDLLIRRADLDAATAALAAAGFVYRHVAGVDMFLDPPADKVRDAVHLVFAGEKVRPEHPTPAPAVEQSDPGPEFRLIRLESLVRMKLAAFRDKDRTHLRDMIEIGLIDESWCDRLEPELAERLRVLLADPDG